MVSSSGFFIFIWRDSSVVHSFGMTELMQKMRKKIGGEAANFLPQTGRNTCHTERSEESVQQIYRT